jgi:hypothetical protein
MGAALIVAAIVAPWLVWLPPVQGAAALDLLGAVAITGAWHGWGRLVARVAEREVPSIITVYWGVAASVALAGVGVALHVYDARFLVIGGTVAHTADLALRFHELRDTDWRRPRLWLVPAAMIAIVAGIAVLGAAGHVGRDFDDDGNVIAQVARLADTGTLGDAIGYPRTSQLGGHVGLAALVSAFEDPSRARLIDSGLGLALLLAVACARIRPRDAGAAMWVGLLVIVACAFALPTNDLAPLWIPAGLVVALDATFDSDTARGVFPIALCAGALAALRVEYAAVAIAYLAAAWWRDRRNARTALVLIGTFIAVLAPYAIARAGAWGKVDASARALFESTHGGFARYGLFAAIAVAAVPLALLAVRDVESRAARVLAVACAAGVGGIAAFGERPFATQLYWPLAIAGFLALAIAFAPRRELAPVALVLSLFACALVADAQAATARAKSWSWRAYDWMGDVEYARHSAPEGGAYDQILTRVPPGDTVAVWVSRPELLDYARHRLIDLRTPRVARWRESGDRLARLVEAAHAHWLLLEDDVPVALEDIAQHSRSTAIFAGVRLVESP